jgi:hypothetical protein
MEMRSAGKLRYGANPARLATAILAAIQGGLVLTQTRTAALVPASSEPVSIVAAMIRRITFPP